MTELEKDTEGVDLERQSEPWPSPGRKLRELRESRGMTQSQVGESLHLTMHYINALENDLYQKLPGKTFAKGYLKSYAALLGADEDDIIERFERLCEATGESKGSEQQLVRQRRAGDQHKHWMMMAGVLIVAVLSVAWWFGREESSATANREAVSAQRRAGTAAATQAPRRNSAEALISRTRETGVAATQPTPQESASQESASQEPASQEPASQESIAAGTPADTLAAGTPLTAESPDIQGGADPDQSAPGTIALAGEPPLPRAEDEAAVAAPAPADSATVSPADAAAPGVREEQTGAGGNRIISLDTGGEDLLVMRLSGTSWIEVDNGENVRLYNDNLHEGDELTIRGQAPFSVLLGDATMVDVQFNSRDVDLASSTRRDNTARLVLEP